VIQAHVFIEDEDYVRLLELRQAYNCPQAVADLIDQIEMWKEEHE
jgi:hypothetical protein